jgi:DNA gyrase/topoisomerase IV subunit B
LLTTTLLPLPKPYIPKNDPELKDALAMLEVVHKIIDNTMDEALNDVAEKIMREE